MDGFILDGFTVWLFFLFTPTPQAKLESFDLWSRKRYEKSSLCMFSIVFFFFPTSQIEHANTASVVHVEILKVIDSILISDLRLWMFSIKYQNSSLEWQAPDQLQFRECAVFIFTRFFWKHLQSHGVRRHDSPDFQGHTYFERWMWVLMSYNKISIYSFQTLNECPLSFLFTSHMHNYIGH